MLPSVYAIKVPIIYQKVHLFFYKIVVIISRDEKSHGLLSVASSARCGLRVKGCSGSDC